MDGSNAAVAPADQEGRLHEAAARAKGILQTRRRRAEYFGGELFGEASWDILLELLIAKSEGRRMRVKSACIGAGVPMSTALRWIMKLADQGIIERHKREGGERFDLELRDEAARQLEHLLLDRGTMSGQARLSLR